jgi:hypothetical protein
LPRTDPAGRELQIRYETDIASGAYVNQRGWEAATLARCPLHPEGGCGIRRHGSYERKHPSGTRIQRFYCRKGHTTISLLPDFLASGLGSTLEELEEVVRTVEEAGSVARAAAKLRPDLGEERSAARWVRRRVRAVRAALTVLVTLLPALSSAQPTVQSVGDTLGVVSVLPALREVGAAHLAALVRPVGFRARARARDAARSEVQQRAGPDPPAATR